MTEEQVRRVLNPRTIAVVGASPNPSRIGGRPIAYMISAGYTGHIYPVSPRYPEVQGFTSYPTLDSVPEPIDLAIIAVNQHIVEDIIREAPPNVGGYVVFSAGYKETGPAGQEAEERLKRMVADRGSMLLGPNCLGFVNPAEGVFATFSSGFEGTHVKSGSLGIITQSGAYGAYLFRLAIERELGVKFWMSTGNEASSDVTAWISYAAKDPGISIILAYLEGIADGERFLQALNEVDAAKKLLIITKAGQSKAGGRAALSHTGSLVGSDEAFDAALRGHRAVRVESIRDMLETVEAAMFGGTPQGSRIGIVTVSGGAGIMMADMAYKEGLEIPLMPVEERAKLLDRVPFAAPDNPVDCTAHMINEPDLLEFTLQLMVGTRQFDAIVIFLSHVIAAPSLTSAVIRALSGVREVSNVPLYVVGLPSVELRLRLRELSCVLTEDPAAALGAVARLARIDHAPGNVTSGKHSESVSLSFPGKTEHEIKKLLHDYGISVPSGLVVASPSEAANAATELGFPVVLKLQHPRLKHKSELRALSVHVVDHNDAKEEAKRLFEVASHHELAGSTVLVEREAPPGIELLVSVRHDPTFGPLLIYGLGGVWTEVLHDVQTDLANASLAIIEFGLRSLRGAALFTGIRGEVGYDVKQIADVIAKIARLGSLLVRDEQVRELEINPLRVTGHGPVVLDAVVYVREDDDVPAIGGRR